MDSKIKDAIEIGIKAAMSHMGMEMQSPEMEEESMPAKPELSVEIEAAPVEQEAVGMEDKKKMAIMAMKKKFNL